MKKVTKKSTKAKTAPVQKNKKYSEFKEFIVRCLGQDFEETVKVDEAHYRSLGYTEEEIERNIENLISTKLATLNDVAKSGTKIVDSLAVLSKAISHPHGPGSGVRYY